MKRGTPDSPKFRRLCRRLGISAPQAIGHLELLWHFTATHAPAGDVGRWADEDIAEACEWTGPVDAFVDALVLERWLDPAPGFRLVVHDWAQHTDNATKRALQRDDARIRNVEERQGRARFAVAPPISEEIRKDWRRLAAAVDVVVTAETQGGGASDGVATLSRQSTTTRPHQAPPNQAGRSAPAPACARDDDEGDTEDQGEDQGHTRGASVFDGPDLEGPPPRRLTDAELAEREKLRPAALRVGDDWAKRRRVVDPRDPVVEPGRWSIERDTFAARLVPHLERYGARDVAAALAWGMADTGDGRWPGWQATLDSPGAVDLALTRGKLVSQYRTSTKPKAPPPTAGRGPEPPDYQAQRQERAAYVAKVEAEVKAAKPPTEAIKATIAKLAGAVGSAP